jgi:hypothetical protein
LVVGIRPENASQSPQGDVLLSLLIRGIV